MARELTASIVIYENDTEELARSIACILESKLDLQLYLVDNTEHDEARKLSTDDRVEYIRNERNLGYAAGHNVAIRLALRKGSRYHLVMNPDVYFEQGCLEALYGFMDANTEVGLVMPKVLYPDGSLQHLCKLLPTPLDLARRRFFPSWRFGRMQGEIYELRFAGHDQIMDVPHLSGCFMFLRGEALAQAGLFDDRFFLYLEDVDLSRRVGRLFRTVYNPEVSIFHRREAGSYGSYKLLFHHVCSAIRYFNKWGYVFDAERRRVNRTTLDRLETRREPAAGE